MNKVRSNWDWDHFRLIYLRIMKSLPMDKLKYSGLSTIEEKEAESYSGKDAAGIIQFYYH